MSTDTVSREMYDALESGIEIATREYESTIKDLESQLAESNALTHRLAEEGLENRELVEFLDNHGLNLELYEFPIGRETLEALADQPFSAMIREEMDRLAEEKRRIATALHREWAEAAEEDRSLMGAERL